MMYADDVDLIREIIEEALKGNLVISTANLIILVTCILTIIYLAFSHVRTKKQIKKVRLEVSKMTDHVSCGIIILDFDTLSLSYANIGFLKMTGYTKDELERVYKNNFFMLGREDHIDDFKLQLSKGSNVNKRMELRRKDDSFIWVHLVGNVVIEKKKRTVYCVLVDINDSVKYEENIKIKEERYRIASDVSCDILFEYDILEDKMFYSERFYEMFGRSETQNNYMKNIMNDPNIYKEDLNRVEKLIEQIKNDTVIETEFRMRDISGNYVWVQFKGKKVKGFDGEYKKVYGKIINVNNVKNELEALKQKSEVDFLTNLYNKESIKMTITENIKSGIITKYALFILDIDNFKIVNDTLGHQFGDFVLSDVASKLKKNYSKDMIFGRIGGDEFIGFMPNATKDKVEMNAQNINRIIFQSYCNDNKSCNVSVSIGVYVTSQNDYDEAFKKADNALYSAKSKGKNGYSIIYGNE